MILCQDMEEVGQCIFRTVNVYLCEDLKTKKIEKQQTLSGTTQRIWVENRKKRVGQHLKTDWIANRKKHVSKNKQKELRQEQKGSSWTGKWVGTKENYRTSPPGLINSNRNLGHLLQE